MFIFVRTVHTFVDFFLAKSNLMFPFLIATSGFVPCYRLERVSGIWQIGCGGARQGKESLRN